jgi:hypothetical protein
MATRLNVSPVINVSKKSIEVTWPGLLNGDVGDAFDLQAYFIASVEWEGTPGAGFQGQTQISNKPASVGAPSQWTNVSVLQATSATELLPGNTIPYAMQVRPSVTAGDGTTNMTCRITLMFY